jgi:hypothetical protein
MCCVQRQCYNKTFHHHVRLIWKGHDRTISITKRREAVFLGETCRRWTGSGQRFLSIKHFGENRGIAYRSLNENILMVHLKLLGTHPHLCQIPNQGPWLCLLLQCSTVRQGSGHDMGTTLKIPKPTNSSCYASTTMLATPAKTSGSIILKPTVTPATPSVLLR